MTNAAFDRLFGGAAPGARDRASTSGKWTSRASVQEVSEEAMLRMARTAHRLTGMKNLCLAGGVALNCVGQRAHPARRARSRSSGSSPRRATRAARWASRSSSGTGISRCAATDADGRRTPCEAPTSARNSRPDEIRGVSRPDRAPSTSCFQPRRADRAGRRTARRRRRSSAGSRGGWSSARGRSAPGASSATRAARRCSRR